MDFKEYLEIWFYLTQLSNLGTCDVLFLPFKWISINGKTQLLFVIKKLYTRSGKINSVSILNEFIFPGLFDVKIYFYFSRYQPKFPYLRSGYELRILFIFLIVNYKFKNPFARMIFFYSIHFYKIYLLIISSVAFRMGWRIQPSRHFFMC